jgi:hypothetical protein
MATVESTPPVSLHPDNTDLLRRYCPGLALHSHEQVAAYIVVDADTGCWRWPGSHSPSGYGRVWTEPTAYGYQESVNVHRYMYDTLVGDIPYGLHIHHRCEVRDCWNPFHLEAVTPREHLQRHALIPLPPAPWRPPVQLSLLGDVP